MWRSQDQGACQQDVTLLDFRSLPDPPKRVLHTSSVHARPAATQTGLLQRAGCRDSPGSQEQMAVARQSVDLVREMDRLAREWMLVCRGVCQCPHQGTSTRLQILVPPVASDLPSGLVSPLQASVYSSAEPAIHRTAPLVGQPMAPRRAA